MINMWIEFLERIGTEYGHSNFILHNKDVLLEIFQSNTNNNGTHVVRVFKREKKIIPFSGYLHIQNLINNHGIMLRKNERISYIDHVCFLKPIEEVVYFSLFTRDSSSHIPNLGIIQNIQLNNNIFEYGNPIMRVNIFDFFYNFQIINDINFFPKNICLNYNLSQIINDSVKGILEIQEQNQNSISLNLSKLKNNNEDSKLAEYFLNLESSEINKKKEIERMIRTISNGNWVESYGGHSYRRIL